uniref:LemA family protein n=1 Tax=viral metagenome TaxID=1070528 RepID=A0A6H2A0K8_9ZZZZ
MLYLIVLAIAIAITVFVIWLVIKDPEGEDVVFAIVASLAVLFMLLTAPIASYLKHADNLGTLRAQKYVIAVYEKRIEELNVVLSKMIPEGRSKNAVLLNQDSPVKSIVDNISIANADLAKARAEEAKAKITIAQRKAGPFAFVVKWCGED